MTDTKTLRIEPMAALREAAALNDWYRQRVMVLANEAHGLAAENEALRKELAEIKAAASKPAKKAD